MSGSGTPSPAPPLRAADSDRVATVQALQDAVARGLLTLEEGGERMAAAFAAVHLRDLAPLTADLPPAPAAARHGAPGWRPLGLMAWEQLRTTMTDARTGRPAAVRIALVTVLTLITVLLVASLVLHGLADAFDGPDGFRGGPDGPGAFWRDAG
ncbi:protein of unknown function [Geodermatophilus saharensis]|uniref:DUF1707 domain-containing protein n=1 Tax=Geodermatophilus saharensis TaxID=1137994 RepID=A0A239BSX4_9ACTN|nr:DUF1707 domain-containing protein [Geodermatophilus saharensis]SNS10531.1 protein of unknown function [Geodermatophilus saharensis]